MLKLFFLIPMFFVSILSVQGHGLLITEPTPYELGKRIIAPSPIQRDDSAKKIKTERIKQEASDLTQLNLQVPDLSVFDVPAPDLLRPHFHAHTLVAIKKTETYKGLRPYVNSPECTAVGILNELLYSDNSSSLSPRKLFSPGALKNLHALGLSNKMLRDHISRYKKTRQKHLIHHEYFPKGAIDTAALRAAGLKRDLINMLCQERIAASPKPLAFSAAASFMTEEERRAERHKVTADIHAFNTARSLAPSMSISDLEESTLTPFINWITLHKNNKTANELDPQAINLVLYDCMKSAIHKNLYRIEKSQEGYLWVYPSILDAHWVDKKGSTNIENMQIGNSPVGINGKTMDAHHVSGDILAHPRYYKEYTERMRAGYSYENASTETLFKEWCVIILIRKETHQPSIHPYDIHPDRVKFEKARRVMNKVICNKLWGAGE